VRKPLLTAICVALAVVFLIAANAGVTSPARRALVTPPGIKFHSLWGAATPAAGAASVPDVGVCGPRSPEKDCAITVEVVDPVNCTFKISPEVLVVRSRRWPLPFPRVRTDVTWTIKTAGYHFEAVSDVMFVSEPTGWLGKLYKADRFVGELDQDGDSDVHKYGVTVHDNASGGCQTDPIIVNTG